MVRRAGLFPAAFLVLAAGHASAAGIDLSKPYGNKSGCINKNGQQVCDVLVSGILPRYPGLRVVSVESGIGWLPFALEALDYQFIEGGGQRTRPEFDRLPSEYFAGQVSITFWFEQNSVRDCVGKTIPVNNVMFETDFPHPTCLYPDPLEFVVPMLKTLTPEQRKKVFQTNAEKLYNLDLSKAPAAG